MKEVLLVFAVATVVLLLLRRLAFISAKDARHHLKHGALIVDVREPDEFAHRHVPGAINLPLGNLRQTISSRIPDKEQVLLLHCLSGGRSAVAQRLLRSDGYKRAYNLGSYGRAARLAMTARD